MPGNAENSAARMGRGQPLRTATRPLAEANYLQRKISTPDKAGREVLVRRSGSDKVEVFGQAKDIPYKLHKAKSAQLQLRLRASACGVVSVDGHHLQYADMQPIAGEEWRAHPSLEGVQVSNMGRAISAGHKRKSFGWMTKDGYKRTQVRVGHL